MFTQVVLYKLLELAVVVHCPAANSTKVSIKTTFAANDELWHKHLRKMFFVVQTEIQQASAVKHKFDSFLCEHLVSFGATLASVVSRAHFLNILVIK